MRASHGTARPYAKALFGLAKERGQVEPVGRELASVVDVLRGAPALREVFARPWVTAAARRALATEIGQRLGVSALVRDFLGLAAAQGRADHLELIAEAYRDLTDDDLGRVRVRVRTPAPLTSDTRADLVGRLERALGGRQVVLDEAVDSTLLGGFVAESGSMILDGSLEGQLHRMRERLARG